MNANTPLYHVRHLCACGANISHSQGDFDAHKAHGGFVSLEATDTHTKGVAEYWRRASLPDVRYCDGDSRFGIYEVAA